MILCVAVFFVWPLIIVTYTCRCIVQHGCRFVMLGFKFPCLLLELPWPLYKSPVVCRRPRTFPRPWKPQLSTDDIVPSLAPGNPSCLYRRPRTFPGPWKPQLSIQTTSYLPWPLETPAVYRRPRLQAVPSRPRRHCTTGCQSRYTRRCNHCRNSPRSRKVR